MRNRLVLNFGSLVIRICFGFSVPLLKPSDFVLRISNRPTSGHVRLHPRASRRRGMSLLEVVLALGILVFMGGVVLGSFYQAIRAAQELRVEAQGMDLAASVLAEVRLGIVPAAEQGAQPFDDPFEDWTWELKNVESDTSTGLETRMLEAVVRHKPSGYTARLAASSAGVATGGLDGDLGWPAGLGGIGGFGASGGNPGGGGNRGAGGTGGLP